MSDDSPASLDELRSEIRELQEKTNRMIYQHSVLDVIVLSLAMRGGMAPVIADELRALSNALGTVGATHIDPNLRRLLSQLGDLGDGERGLTTEELKASIDLSEQVYRLIGSRDLRG